MFDRPKAREMGGLVDRETFQETCMEEIPADANIIGGRLVLAVNNTETENPVYKSRFVVQAHSNYEKDMLLHCANTVRPHTVKLIVAITAILCFRLWSQDFIQVDLQAGKSMLLEAYGPPPD